MRKTFKLIFLWAFMVSLFWFGCASRISQVNLAYLRDGKYDSPFPVEDSSPILEQILETVKHLNSIAYYQGFIFDEQTQLETGHLRQDQFMSLATESFYLHRSASGTATVIYHYNRRFALLTCAHIVDFPDTSLVFFKDEKGMDTPYIHKLFIKQRQDNYVVGLSEGSKLEILVLDRERDIALLGKRYHRPFKPRIPVFAFPRGVAGELRWGTFIYMVGFPKGHKMVTRGIVSSPNRDKSHSFLVDGLFNRGFSGGLLLAIRDGVPNFELVGLANSTSAEWEFVLSPEKRSSLTEFDLEVPYTGDVFVKLKRSINYGITYGISMEAILASLSSHLETLQRMGYLMEHFFVE